MSLTKRFKEVATIAESFGLKPNNIVYEVVPPHVLHSIGSYGLVNHTSHWEYGKAYKELSKGGGKIYELVLNTEPCLAFLSDDNSDVINTLVSAHVIGHSDFFTQNITFEETDRQAHHTFRSDLEILESLSGESLFSETLDLAISLAEHEEVMNFFTNDPQLSRWQQTVFDVFKQRERYFKPQVKTKIINEGWATFWHEKIMEQIDLSTAEYLEIKTLHENIIRFNGQTLNPYHIGYHLMKEIEKEHGIDALFYLRETENDVSFLRHFLTDELAKKYDLPTSAELIEGITKTSPPTTIEANDSGLYIVVDATKGPIHEKELKEVQKNIEKIRNTPVKVRLIEHA